MFADVQKSFPRKDLMFLNEVASGWYGKVGIKQIPQQITKPVMIYPIPVLKCCTYDGNVQIMINY